MDSQAAKVKKNIDESSRPTTAEKFECKISLAML